MIKVYFVPVNTEINDYINNIVNALGNNGITIVNKDCKTKKEKIQNAIRTFGKVDFYHFNWIENRVASGTFKNRIMGALILCGIKLIKRHNGHVAWTMHNKLNHNADESRNDYYNEFLQKYIPLMDLIVVHAKSTIDILTKEYGYPIKRICYVPHGSYIEEYTLVEPTKPSNILTFLSFGSITKYKNIPMLVRAFKTLNKGDTKLEIYGRCNDKDLLDRINKSVGECSNIFFYNEFVPDDKIKTVFSNANVAVIPYDKSTMINSGVAIMALSQATPVISSDFGAIEDMSNYDFIHMYRYQVEEEHLINLTKEMEKVYSEWKSNPNMLYQEGKHAYDYAKTSLSWEHIGAVIASHYKEILGN